MYILYTSKIIKSTSNNYHIVYLDKHALVNMYIEECSDGDKYYDLQYEYVLGIYVVHHDNNNDV